MVERQDERTEARKPHGKRTYQTHERATDVASSVPTCVSAGVALVASQPPPCPVFVGLAPQQSPNLSTGIYRLVGHNMGQIYVAAMFHQGKGE